MLQFDDPDPDWYVPGAEQSPQLVEFHDGWYVPIAHKVQLDMPSPVR